jgi:hypothetical protein
LAAPNIRTRLAPFALAVLVLAQAAYAPPVATAAEPDPSPSASPTQPATPAPTPTASATPTASSSIRSAAPSATPTPPAGDPQAAGEERDPATEVVAARTATSRTFRAPDGTTTTELFSDPIHFRPVPDAGWQPIDLSFEPVPGTDRATRLTDSPVPLTVAPGADQRGFLGVTIDGHRVSLRPVSASRRGLRRSPTPVTTSPSASSTTARAAWRRGATPAVW